MRLMTSIRVCLILCSATGSLAAGRPAQKYAPIVGRWKIDLTLYGQQRQLEFETDDHGNYGIGKGYVVINSKDNGDYEFPAIWWNIDPSRIRISTEIDFHDTADNPNTFLNVVRDKKLRGTLVLRISLDPYKHPKGDARFIDENLSIHTGSFTMIGMEWSKRLKDKLGER